MVNHHNDDRELVRLHVKRFEATGKISLLSLTKLAMALDMADELRELFTQVPYRNIQEVIDERKRNTTSFI